uniref:Uncharacterized protein n=1 Tax=Mola mola TaxID=94237 RepID=A0A3Q3X5S4_MOLML
MQHPVHTNLFRAVCTVTQHRVTENKKWSDKVTGFLGLRGQGSPVRGEECGSPDCGLLWPHLGAHGWFWSFLF